MTLRSWFSSCSENAVSRVIENSLRKPNDPSANTANVPFVICFSVRTEAKPLSLDARENASVLASRAAIGWSGDSTRSAMRCSGLAYASIQSSAPASGPSGSAGASDCRRIHTDAAARFFRAMSARMNCSQFSFRSSDRPAARASS